MPLQQLQKQVLDLRGRPVNTRLTWQETLLVTDMTFARSVIRRRQPLSAAHSSGL